MGDLTSHKLFRPALAVTAAAALIGGLILLNPGPGATNDGVLSGGAPTDDASADAETGGAAEPGEVLASDAPGAAGGATTADGTSAGGTGAGGGTDGSGGAGGAGGADGSGGTGGTGGTGGAGGAGAASCTFDGCASAQGVTADTIRLGFYVLEGGDAAFAALGVSANLGNQERQAQILVDDLNKRGGIAGRKIVPVIVKQEAGTADPAGDVKRACVTFAEDKKVFAVIPDGQLQGQDFRRCLGQRKTFLFGPAGQVPDAKDLEGEYPWSVLPNAKAVDRVARTLIPELQQQGYFSKWDPQGVMQDVRVGLITYEDPGYARTADRVVKPALKKLGHPVEEVRLNAGDTSQLQSQMQQAVLRFKQKNVTHVMFLPGRDAFFFYQSAESQQYRPRYAVDSNTFPNLMEVAAPRQAKGAVGIGWAPSFDVSLSDESRHPPSAQEKRCYALMQRGGEDARNRSSRAGNFCDMVWLFEAAANRAGPNLTAGSLAGGLRGMRSWDFLGFPTDFTKLTPDSSYSYRRLAFDDVKCKCFMYRSGPLSDR